MANDQSIETLKGIGEKTAKLFEKVGIRTIDDLLHYYPRGYDTYGEPKAIGELSEDETGTVEGFFKERGHRSPRKRSFHRPGDHQRYDRKTSSRLVSHAVFKEHSAAGQSFYLPGPCDPQKERTHDGTAPDV